jgi:hypothetical protein
LSLTVRGQPGVRAALLEAPKETRKLIREVVNRHGPQVTQRTQQNAPYETGALREALEWVPPKGRGLTGYIRVRPGTFRGRVPSAYVLSIEFGAKGRPFIRSTAEAERPRFDAAIAAIGAPLEQTLTNFGSRNL